MSEPQESTPTPSATPIDIVAWLMTPTTERSHHDHAMCTTLKQAFTLGMKGRRFWSGACRGRWHEGIRARGFRIWRQGRTARPRVIVGWRA